MNAKELARYERSNLRIDEGRVLTYSNIVCPLDCKYCFANEIIRGRENEKNIYVSDEQFVLLKQLPPEITTVMLGCDTEFLQDKTQALEILRKLSTLGKDISVITKLPLADGFVHEFASIANTMKQRGNFMTFSVSIACTDSKGKWEPKVPSVESRIETLCKVSNFGIDTMVAVRPLIPDVAERELEMIVDKTKDYVCGYYSGPMYLKRLGEDTLTADELASLGCIVSDDAEEVHWMPGGNSFLRVEAPKLMSYLQAKVEQSGKMFFEGAADGIDYLRRSKYAKP